MCTIQINLFGKDIRRFADGTYYVIGLWLLLTAQVLYFVIGLIKGRTNQVGETSINDGKLLDESFFYI